MKQRAALYTLSPVLLFFLAVSAQAAGKKKRSPKIEAAKVVPDTPAPVATPATPPSVPSAPVQAPAQSAATGPVSAPAPAASPSAPRPPAADAREVSFVSRRAWTAPRWYLLGRWNSAHEIQWPGGVRISLRFDDPACANIKEPGRIVRDSDDAEVLSSGAWFALELNPDVAKEEVEAQIGSEGPNGPACRSRIPLVYAWNGERGQRDPVLFLKPTGNEFFKRVFHVTSPAVAGRADIQLEVLLGLWRGNFPSVTSGGSSSFFLAPAAIARGEWLLPVRKKHFGLQVALEQNVANIGQVQNQNVYFGDWLVGAFYVRNFPIAEGLQLRGRVAYHQHAADDNPLVHSLAYNGRDARHILLGASGTIYFARAWMTGIDLDYALPGNLAGRGPASYFDSTLRGGRRLTGFLYGVSEIGYRVQGISGAPSETQLRFQAGVRLDL